MSHPKRARRRRIRGEQGYILIVTALLIVPLVVFTGFGVDLGSWYAQAAKEQRAVDAASLAGVVQLPSQANATTAAIASLKANGYVFSSCTSGTSVTVNTCGVDFPSTTGQEMTVSLDMPANIYFAGAAGLHSQSLTRTATAVYNLHIPLGSPTNTFGNDPSVAGGSAGNVWAAINGPYSDFADGDPYATKCSGQNGNTSTSCSANYDSDMGGGAAPNGGTNKLYNPDGYLWSVDVPAADAGTNITVSVYDPAFGPSTGSPQLEGYGNSSNKTGFNTMYAMYNTLSSESQYSIAATNAMSASTCNNGGAPTTGGPGTKIFAPGTGATSYTGAWYVLCRFAVPSTWAGGIYPLQVKTSNFPSGSGFSDVGTGYNSYSLKASSSGTTQPAVYALQSLSIWTPTAGNSTFYLANIAKVYAGHTLDLELYDPGDGDDTSGTRPFTMQILGPPTPDLSLPITWPAAPVAGTTYPCNYNQTASLTINAATPNVSSNCKITTLNTGSKSGIYNGHWLHIVIKIPTVAAGYTCVNDCWWSINYDFGGGTPTDRTVWVVNVLGDPVHLVN